MIYTFNEILNYKVVKAKMLKNYKLKNIFLVATHWKEIHYI